MYIIDLSAYSQSLGNRVTFESEKLFQYSLCIYKEQIQANRISRFWICILSAVGQMSYDTQIQVKHTEIEGLGIIENTHHRKHCTYIAASWILLRNKSKCNAKYSMSWNDMLIQYSRLLGLSLSSEGKKNDVS